MLTLNSVKSTDEIKESIKNYQEAISWVTSYCFAITQTQSLVLERPPEWYAQFQQDMLNAKAHGTTWIDSITMRLTTIPNTIVSYDLTYQSCSDTVKSCLKKLIVNPDNTQAKKVLIMQLSNLLSDIKRYRDNVNELYNDIREFKTNLDTDAASFNANYKNALETEEADKETVEKLTKQVAELTEMVFELTRQNIGFGFGSSAFVAIGCMAIRLGTKTLNPAFAIIAILSGITSLAMLVATIQTNREIKEKNAEIEEMSDNIDAYNAYIATLGILANSLVQLIELIEKAVQGLAIINEAWSLLAKQLEQLYHRLEDSNSEVWSSDYENAMKDILASETQWDELVKFASLFVDVKFLYDDTHYEILTA